MVGIQNFQFSHLVIFMILQIFNQFFEFTSGSAAHFKFGKLIIFQKEPAGVIFRVIQAESPVELRIQATENSDKRPEVRSVQKVSTGGLSTCSVRDL